jgi:NAD(P)-dependent dehydrogenase (short-subunit alcohol dehydrogenase family)
MQRRTILITGSTDGIGKQTALELAKLGANVIIHGRNPSKCTKVLEEIKKASKNQYLEFVVGDLSSLSQIRDLANQIKSKYKELHVLINNAGIFETEKRYSEDRYEMTFAVNYLAPFALTLLLLPLLKKNAPSRVILVSSRVHSTSIDFDNLNAEKHFSGYEAYGLSKLCNILFTYQLAKRLEGKNITVNCLHPGVINTKLLRAAFSGGAPASEGAKTPVYLATSNDVENITGNYFIDRSIIESASISYNSDIQNKLWILSENLTKVKYEDLDL